MIRAVLHIASFLVATTLIVPASSAEEKMDKLYIEKPWARASVIKSRPAAAYLTIVNRSGKTDRLLSATSSIAENVSLHLSEMRNGVMKMSPVKDLPILSGESVTLKPGNLHLMLMKLNAPLKKGGILPLTLNFEGAGEINVEAHILGPGSSGPD